MLRSCNQEKVKQDLLQNLTTFEAIVVIDWAMKFHQMKFREKQTEWFGKTEFSWHLFDSCTKDWYAVNSILEDLLLQLKSTNPSISQVHLHSDEAGWNLCNKMQWLFKVFADWSPVQKICASMHHLREYHNTFSLHDFWWMYFWIQRTRAILINENHWYQRCTWLWYYFYSRKTSRNTTTKKN